MRLTTTRLTTALPAATLVAAALVTGCSSSPASTSGGGRTTASPSAAAAAEALDAARADWARFGLRDYDLIVDRTCFCSVTSTVRVEVRGGQTIRKTLLGTSHTSPATAPPDDTPTSVEAVFELIARALPVDESVEVVYDVVSGVPVRIDLDPRRDTYDDEDHYAVRVIAPGAPTGAPSGPPIPTGLPATSSRPTST